MKSILNAVHILIVVSVQKIVQQEPPLPPIYLAAASYAISSAFFFSSAERRGSARIVLALERLAAELLSPTAGVTDI